MLSTLTARIKSDPYRYAPWLYLLVCILAYGLLIPGLGFYWDDWPTIFYTQRGRVAQLADHFSYDRPLSFIVYFLIGRLGTSALWCHLAALTLRWLTVISLAWALQPLWPKQPRRILYIALVFAVYPGYYFQPLPVIFVAHLATYVAFFVSLGAMGRALREPAKFKQYTALALTTCALQMFTLEYYVGLELIRPLYIWLTLQELPKSPRSPWQATLSAWMPYAAIFAAWVVWRLFLFHPPVEPYPLAIERSLAGLVDLILIGLRDFWFVLVSVWVQTKAALLSFTSSGDWLGLGASALVAASLAYVLLKLTPAVQQKDQAASKNGLALGLLAFFAGLGPIWVIGETIAQGEYNQRYILIAMFGAALLIVSALTLLVRNERYRAIFIIALVALAVGYQVRQADIFRQDWERQRAFYWQLAWRAPAIDPNTALITNERLTYWTGEPLLGDALNTLYPPRLAAPYADLWAFELTRTRTLNTILDGELLSNDYRGLLFSMQQPDDVLVYYAPPGGCLRVLTPLDAADTDLPAELRQTAPYSNTANIHNAGSLPDAGIFGREPERDWCYYYEKADLARQAGDWQTILSLHGEARAANLYPMQSAELVPFIQAYANTADWATARDLTAEAFNLPPQSDGSLPCALWSELPAEPRLAAEVREFLSCSSQP